MSEEKKIKPRGQEEVVPLEEVPKKKAPPKKRAKKTAPKKAAPVVAAKPEKRFSFEQWAARRGVKAHHRGGLRAFVKNPNKSRTLTEWDKCFVGY